MNSQIPTLKKAFPSHIQKEAEFVFTHIDLISDHNPSSPFCVTINGQIVEISYRVYYNEENLLKSKQFNPLQKEILNCFYSRHHNGFIREQCLVRIIGSNNPWTVPYVVKLLGEYVIEILNVINKGLNELNLDIYLEFLTTNSEFYHLTKQRVASYWDCYYRWQFPNKEDYVGFQILGHFDEYLKQRDISKQSSP